MAMISDSDIQALITPEIRREVIEEITKKSAVLGHFTRLNDMSTSETELRIFRCFASVILGQRKHRIQENHESRVGKQTNYCSGTSNNSTYFYK